MHETNQPSFSQLSFFITATKETTFVNNFKYAGTEVISWIKPTNANAPGMRLGSNFELLLLT